MREVVEYAAARFIEVVPEMELPGHCCAALAAYPDLSCTGNVKRVSAEATGVLKMPLSFLAIASDIKRPNVAHCQCAQCAAAER